MTIDALTALDQTQESTDQGTLDEVKKQRDLYKKAFYVYADALQGLNQKRISLQDRPEILLVIPQNGIPTMIAREHPPVLGSSIASELTSMQTLDKIEELDEKNDHLTAELIAKCSRQRDKYKEGICRLKDTLATCQRDILVLEEKIAERARLLSTPKKTDDFSPSGSPEPARISPNTMEQRLQIQKLAEEVVKVKEGRIEARFKDGPLQNYIFLLFIQAKNKKNEPIDLKPFHSNQLSTEDRKLLEEAAKTAVKNMDPQGYPDYDLKKLFRTKERIIDQKIKAIDFLRQKFGTTDRGISQLEGTARDIFSHFFSLLQLNKGKENTKAKKDYKDFIFSHDPFLAADLLLAEKIYTECETYYKKNRGPQDPQLVLIQEKIKQIQEVQRLFLILLENCQVK